MTIKNIIFDLGGVLINIDQKRMIDSFKKLGAINFLTPEAKRLVNEYGVGKITTAAFREQLIAELDIEISETEFKEAWNSELGDIPKEKLEFLQQLREANYKLYLFSNTNEMHYEEIHDICRRDHGVEGLNDYFDKQYFSHQIKRAKPEVAAFQAILKENNLLAEETVFIDDIPSNIEGAKLAGLHTIHFIPGTNILTILDRIEEINELPLETEEAEEARKSLSFA